MAEVGGEDFGGAGPRSGAPDGGCPGVASGDSWVAGVGTTSNGLVIRGLRVRAPPGVPRFPNWRRAPCRPAVRCRGLYPNYAHGLTSVALPLRSRRLACVV